MSNNAAEYSALNLGLTQALSMGIQHLYCEGDSQLVVKQLNGSYKVKNANMQSYYQETQSLISQFKSCKVHHIRREFNKRADELANQGRNTISVSFKIIRSADNPHLLPFLRVTAMTTKTDSGFDEQFAL